MTTLNPPHKFRDLRVPNGHLGYPELCALPNGALLVSTWGGHCLEVNPDSGQIMSQPRIGMPQQFGASSLRSPTASIAQPILCSAATRAIWTEFWQLGATQTSRIETDGAVNSVAISPRGDLLAAGLGSYPLALNDRPHAGIELFSISEPSQCLVRRFLPGVAVDRVVFHPTRDLLVAVTGARSQDRGNIILLDPHSLGLVDVGETESCNCIAVMIDDYSGLLLLAFRHGIQVLPLDRLWDVGWRWITEDKLFGAAYDIEHEWIFLSNGQVLGIHGREVTRLDPLEECSGMAVLQDGRVAGISQNGVLRVWEVNSGGIST